MHVSATEIRYVSTGEFPADFLNLIDQVQFKMGQELPGIVLETGESVLWRIDDNSQYVILHALKC